MSMYNNFFDWSHTVLIRQMLPPLIRKPKMLAFITALSTGLQRVFSDLKSFRVKSAYDNEFVQDRIQFKKYLQDEFGAGILLEHSPYKDPIVLHKRIENKSVRFYKKSENKPKNNLYFKQEYITQIHFFVKIPNALNLVEAEIERLRAYVDNRKQPNKNYIIQFI